MAVTDQQVYADPEWLRAQPGLIARFSQILTNSGIIPDAATLSAYGLSGMFDPNVSAAAAANPYSTAAQLKRTLSSTLNQNNTRAGASNMLFSGAFQNLQDQAGRDYQQAYSTAGANTLSQLLGIKTDQENVYNSVYGRLLSQPVTPDTTVYPAAATPTIGAGLPQPQTTYTRTGPETPMSSWQPFTPKKPKPVTYSQALHAGGAF